MKTMTTLLLTVFFTLGLYSTPIDMNPEGFWFGIQKLCEVEIRDGLIRFTRVDNTPNEGLPSYPIKRVKDFLLVKLPDGKTALIKIITEDHLHITPSSWAGTCAATYMRDQ